MVVAIDMHLGCVLPIQLNGGVLELSLALMQELREQPRQVWVERQCSRNAVALPKPGEAAHEVPASEPGSVQVYHHSVESAVRSQDACRWQQPWFELHHRSWAV